MPEVKRHIKNLFRTHSEHTNRKAALRLDMNESVEGLPDQFVKSVLAEIDGNFMASYPEYRLLEEKLAKHNNLNIDNICLSNGSDGAIKLIFEAYVLPGDNILLTDPTFAMYPVYGQMYDANVSLIKYDSNLRLSAEEFCGMISKGTKLAVLVNPNNPTGSILSRDDIIKVIKKASQSDTLVIVDEAYFYYCQETVIDLVGNYNNLVVLRTFSKLCGIAAARLGYAAACSEIIDNLRRVKPTYDVNGLAVLFAEKLLDRPELMQDLMRAVNNGKEFLSAKLSSEDIEHHIGHANFVLIKCADRAAEVTKRLEDKNILVSSGFRQEFLKDYIRITIGSREKMEQFWREFIRIWRN